MKLSWSKYKLNFITPVKTSRGVMKSRDVWYLFCGDKMGECAPLPGLSLDDLDLMESKLDDLCAEPERFIADLSLLNEFPSIRCGLEMLEMPCPAYFEPIAINGLIWMGDPLFMVQQIEQKLCENWRCIKMKIGAVDFDEELGILTSIANHNIELRVDANGAFDESNVKEKISRLAGLNLHSIEQPVKPGQWDLMAELCETSPIPIALDEELISLRKLEDRIAMLDMVKPQYIVLKPSLLGGFSEAETWIELAEARGIKWWVTSALESNVGLEAIANWVSQLKLSGFQGLGTGQLFCNNIPSSIKVENSYLKKDTIYIWNDIRAFVSEWLSPELTIKLQTSGSTGVPKRIEVKKEWMRNSANLTGETFGLSEGDSVLLCLPMQYIAAKMMVVRALELGLDLIVTEPKKVIQVLADFVAMVPIQLENSLDYIDDIKVLIVGGSHVRLSLLAKLQNISTNIYETYGMTETLTHVAIKPLNGAGKSEYFSTLTGVSLEVDERGCLVIYAPKLNPEKVITNDMVELADESRFKLLGRYDNVINSGGVKMHPEIIEEKLELLIPYRRYFVAGIYDEEFGQRVVLFIEGEPTEILLDSLSKYERPKEIVYIKTFVETGTGKINRQKIINGQFQHQ